jgi:hypothetical protein
VSFSWETASRRRSSGTAKSKSGSSVTDPGLYLYTGVREGGLSRPLRSAWPMRSWTPRHQWRATLATRSSRSGARSHRHHRPRQAHGDVAQRVDRDVEAAMAATGSEGRLGADPHCADARDLTSRSWSRARTASRLRAIRARDPMRRTHGYRSGSRLKSETQGLPTPRTWSWAMVFPIRSEILVSTQAGIIDRGEQVIE